MPVYAIGDIQGCDTEFARLLDTLRFDPGSDRLWLTGDLVNRGPASLAVLRRVRALGSAVTLVLGNHDLHLLAMAAGCAREKSNDTLDDILLASDAGDLLDWLRQQPLVHHDTRLGWTLVHAGLPPQWSLDQALACSGEVAASLREAASARELFRHMYGNQPDCWDETLAGWDRLRFIINCCTRLRFCDSSGRIDLGEKGPPDRAPAGLMPWFRVPGRRSANLRILCGHWSALGFHDGDGVLAIDTGCVWGGRLCAVRLDAQADPVFVSCS